ncbi:hypothetical protein TBLA_0G00170 [Henningerozyma blattae CBS 6284]|uniref:J protein JJJ1 n=1 Tax=Henningerozyma blattae (strain ATCC 34711 / CBS 6284 / DSM 70876 / NBRC 10599 / NRRL Y-10934 / UCD 77-7) TaxID=1071380 RepID=I2H6G6_HENB6|nr:hypothetical protein TBLA_0G00170 [Tetrapisispora blattae CBS 6284]CCH61968.1 hypothetical protein TBLA_0G00170 [Tetrapisispora blattae CBS 6284]
MKTCYYELLEVSEYASDLELKKAYRKKALQYHPDKNRENPEEATAIFSEIRAAYEVLSDPQERAWYDSHKQQILNDTPLEDEYEVDSIVTGVTTDEVLMFFNSSLYTRIDDSPAGIYQIISKIFSRLSNDEVNNGKRLSLKNFDKYQDFNFEIDLIKNGFENTCTSVIDRIKEDETYYFLPVFGCSNTDYDYLNVFYKRWSGFNTLKSFNWKDEYMYLPTYDRKTKREVHKRNEKSRQKARNEYNKTVRRFVDFVKKLDPRIKKYKKHLDEERKRKEKLKNETTKDRSKDSLAAEKYEEQEWQSADTVNWADLEKHYDNNQKKDIDLNHSELHDIDQFKESSTLAGEEEVIVYECDICNKIFKSLKQLENHLSTRMHKKNVYKIQKQMKKENIEFGLDSLSDLDEFKSADEEESLLDDYSSPSTPISNKHDDSKQKFDTDIIGVDVDAELAEIERQLAEMESDEDIDEILENPSNTSTDEISKSDTTNSYTNLATNLRNLNIEVDDVYNSDEDTLPILGKKARRREAKKRLLKKEKSTEPSVENNILDAGDKISELLASLNASTSDLSDDDWSTSKKKKAKSKKDKKNNKKSSSDPVSQIPIPLLNTQPLHSSYGTEVCGTCGQGFDTRNKLFLHVKSLGHAAPPSKVRSNLKGRKNRR